MGVYVRVILEAPSLSCPLRVIRWELESRTHPDSRQELRTTMKGVVLGKHHSSCQVGVLFDAFKEPTVCMGCLTFFLGSPCYLHH
jgi:hypothetical protein